jgi:hypothetical protein
LVVNPGSNNDKLFSLLMGEYRSLFGLASIRDQAGSYLYDIAFWCNEKGVSARQQLTLKHIEGSGTWRSRKKPWCNRAVMKNAS